MEIRFYAACLAAYNNGHLHGAWVEATDDADAMQEAVNAMLAASPIPDAEEWAVHDWDDPTGALSAMGETSDLQRIADAMEAIWEISDDHGDDLVKILVDWASDIEKDPSRWVGLIADAFGGTYGDPEDYAAEITEEGMIGAIPDALRAYIDWRLMARDMALNGEVDFIDRHTGRNLQDYDDMRGRECIVMYNR